MARTRQRAKQRQAKRREQERKAQGTTGQKPPSTPAERAVVEQAEAYEVGDVLEEAGGDAEEAAERLDAEPSDEAITPVEAPEPAEAPEAVEAPPAPSAPKTRDRTQRKGRPAEDGGDGRGGRRGRGGGRGDDGGRRGGRGAGAAGQARQREARQRGRLINFLIQVWAELRRVQWPDRNQITQATSVVVVFCILAGLYLALFDWLFARLVKAIL
jgi:preprotein translocase SecE subunit